MKKYMLYILLSVAGMMNAQGDNVQKEAGQSLFEDIENYEKLSNPDDNYELLTACDREEYLVREVQRTKESLFSALNDCKAKNNCKESELEPLFRKHVEAVSALDKNCKTQQVLHARIKAKARQREMIWKKYQQ